MKEYLKNMWISYVLAFVISFMFFIVEPISMYSNNINDFWFDLNMMLKPILLCFVLTFIILSIIENVLFFVNKKVLNVFNTITIISFICFYIQGNFLVGRLPVLIGEEIDWSKYKIDSIISIALWIIVIIMSIICIKKYTINKYTKIGGYICSAIIVMLSCSLITTFITSDVLYQKKYDFISTATQKNLNTYSSNNNFIILLLDAVDSQHFQKVLNNNDEFSKMLKDFTYYPDTMSVDPYTQESIPQILSGHTYENDRPFVDYYIEAMNDSTLLNNLYENDYDVNIYEPEFFYYSENALKINNITNSNEKNKNKMNYSSFIRNLIKYELFRYLPYSLKKYSKIETLNFKNCHVQMRDYLLFEDDTINFINYFSKMPFVKKDKNEFKFFHLAGAHVPFTFDKDLNVGDNKTYDDEIEGCLTVTEKYLKFLKEKDLYNNSKIIIMADHGYGMTEYGDGTYTGRQNPLLLIKRKDEIHKKMKVSKKAISYNDLNGAYIDLINNKKSKQLFENISDNQVRRFMFYKYGQENHMTEYETTGKAWETDKLKSTGKEYIRK